MESDTDTCFICNKPLNREEQSNNVRTMKKQAVATIKAASKQRNDKKHLKLRNVTSLTLHHTCYSVYIREKSINAAKNRRSRLITQTRRANKLKRLQEAQSSHPLPQIHNEDSVTQSLQPKPKKPVVKPEPREFDFKLDCLFCGTDASDKFVEKVKKNGLVNKRVSFVTKAQTKEKILSVTKGCDEGDVYMKAIEKRVQDVDLVQVMGRYHKACLASFHNPIPKTNVKGRPIREETIKTIDFIINHIVSTSDVSQYSLKSLIESHPDADDPSLYNMKDRIEKFAGDELVVSPVVKADCNLLLIGSRGQLLSNWQNHLQLIRDKQSDKKCKNAKA